ncbi:MAG: protein adenylyltransferase SelO family protein [Sphingomonadaceae bacterium]
MREEPQAASYHADTPITALAPWLADTVNPADFPETKLRFANRRWAPAVGLDNLSKDDWTAHFGRFDPLPDNLPQPLALRYHGHQFRVYNPEIGDGRGFLCAQMRDGDGRLMDFGTKGSGQTPWSRAGDGRLTLKGAVREILATEMLEALGVDTSKTFAVIETGEQLWRGDEPSPTRSAVLTRLSHGHIRIGTFQRLLALEEREHMTQLVDYCLAQFPGPPPPEDAPGRDEPAVRLMHHVVERMADLAASWMVAGFVHGVLNTDNMNVSGESFDYGPWRFLPRWDPGFTAAYFDHAGLYAFGRQPEALHWNCGQFAVALRLLCDAPPLIAALERFGPLYMAAVGRRWCWRLGVESLGGKADQQLVAASEAQLTATQVSPDRFFFDHRGGRNAEGDLAKAIEGRETLSSDRSYWKGDEPEAMLIEEVEAIWSAIADNDDWTMLESKIDAVRAMGQAHGPPPVPAGHTEQAN